MLNFNCNNIDCLKEEVMKYYNVEYKNSKKTTDDCFKKEFHKVNSYTAQIK